MNRRQAHNKWNNQQIHKRFKNRHNKQKSKKSDLYNVPFKRSQSIRACCNKYTKHASSQNLRSGSDATKSAYWSCNVCTFHNYHSNPYCSMCGSTDEEYMDEYVDNEDIYDDDIDANELDELENIEFDEICNRHKWNKRKTSHKNGYSYATSKPKRFSFHSACHPKRVKSIKKQISSKYSEYCWKEPKEIRMKRVLNRNLCGNFTQKQDGNEKLVHVYHGTQSKNDQSIIDNGLVVGGTKGVQMRIGAAYGNGVYCSPSIGMASGYESGSMFVCVVKDEKVQKNGDIWVVPDDRDILPVYLASFDY